MTTLSTSASWICLLLAIVFEISGTILMKVTRSMVSASSLLMLIAFSLSLVFCTIAARRIPISVVYAVWSAIGIAAVAMIGVVWFKESTSLIKIGSLILIIVGIVGLLLHEG